MENVEVGLVGKSDIVFIGFQTLMRVREDEYLSWIDTASLLVFIHDQDDTVMAESVRYQAGPADETTYFVAKVIYKIAVEVHWV